MKRFLAFLLVAMLLLPQGLGFVFADDEEKPIPEPKLVLDGREIPGVEAGGTLDIKLNLKNISNYSARNVIVTPLFEETEGDPFILEAANLKRTINSLQRNKDVTLNFKVKISDMAQAKTYGLKVKIDYQDIDGKAYTTTETVFINVTKQKSAPNITLSRMEITPSTIQPGEPAQAILYLKNNGGLVARNVRISIDGLSNDGFTVVKGSNNEFVREIAGGGEAFVIFDLHASPKLKNGNHSLTLKISYQDQTGKDFNNDQVFFLAVGGDLTSGPQLSIDNIQAPTGGVGVNDTFQVSFDLNNNGNTAAKNVKVTVDGKEALLPRSQNTKILQTLEGKSSSHLDFSFYVAAEAAKQNHPILITVEYDQGSEDTKETLQQYVGINVEGGSGSSTPKIIIDEYYFDPQIVRAGENFELYLSFMNTNAEKAVENIKIFLTVVETTEKSGNVFTPVNSSNTFYIDRIEPKGRVSKQVTMYAVPDAQPKTHTIQATFQYEDSTGKTYEATELFGIPVVQQSRLEVSEFTVPTEVFLGEPMYLFMEFYNMGKVTLSNLMLKVEGNFQVQNGNYFVGNFESGSSDYFEVTIIPTEPGPLEGEVIFTYEDAAGDVKEIRKPIQSNVIEMPMEEFPPMDEMPIEEEQSFFVRLLKNKIVWAVVALAGAGGAFWFIRRKKKLKGLAEDEI